MKYLVEISKIGLAVCMVVLATGATAAPRRQLTVGIICEVDTDCEQAIRNVASVKAVFSKELEVDVVIRRTARVERICPRFKYAGSRIPYGFSHLQELGFSDLDLTILASPFPSKCDFDLHDLTGVLGQSPVSAAWIDSRPHILNVRFQGNFAADRLVVIHEMGHYLGALHDDSGIMVPYASELRLGRRYFSKRSTWEITAHKNLSLVGG